MEYLPTLNDEPKEYRAFILRWWDEDNSQETGTPQWRFLLEDLHNKQARWGFNDFRELTQFLQTEMQKHITNYSVEDVFEPIQHHADD